MCRLLSVTANSEFDIADYLQKFAEISKKSKEYQGDGWGCAYLKENEWIHYKNINPIWQDDLNNFGKTTRLIAHARSAFENTNIIVKNNMPFYDDKYIFIFNGELRGVKIKEKGRIGAEKIFNFIKRFDQGNMYEALKKGIDIIKKRTKEYRAINVLIADKKNIYVSNNFSGEPDYFTLHKKVENNILTICSDKFTGEENWSKFENNSSEVF